MTARASLLPVLQALAADSPAVGVPAPTPAAVDLALTTGFGAALAHLTSAGWWPGLGRADDIHGADLTARLIGDASFEVLEDVAAMAAQVSTPLLLLKGAATAWRYYPAPHLRPLGDLDVLVPTEAAARLTRRLAEYGFVERALPGAPDYTRHHHGVPLWHPARHVWVELHTRLHPPAYPLAYDTRFDATAWAPHLVDTAFGAQRVLVMGHEAQLVYTAARWCETLRFDRGLVPLLDLALLLRTERAAIDWARVQAIVQGSWAVTALRLAADVLRRWQLPSPPADVVRWLSRADRYGSVARLLAARALTGGLLYPRTPLQADRVFRYCWGVLSGTRRALRDAPETSRK